MHLKGDWWTSCLAVGLWYVPERHQILGSNLATAHFVVARGGAVRFCGSEEWVRKKEGEDEYGLPHTYVPGMLLEAVDASGMGLCYEGLDNFVNLQHLRWLGLAGSSHVDDWFLDRISSQFQDTVQHLDISDCANVTERGLCALYRMSALRTLKVRGPATLCQEFQLACLMLEEIHCGLHVEGVTYLSLPDDPDGRGQP
ncbi:hypothetical protein PR048_004011 [Dryococelus australis]|uniref:ATP synthase subunit s, mitochondrial n=1 Tax=Dryococelus australis TaxID=614101 RepID=A0ABQ9I4A5_9NEOP|nr:hypothetical protein PR048_004011 [Dryococelus australis]